jgi:hypothetical protein
VTERDHIVERAIAALREPVALRGDVERRVLEEVATLPIPRRPGPLGLAAGWLVRPRAIRVSPLAGLAAAAAVALAALGVRAFVTGRPSAPSPVETQVAPVPQTAVQFVIVAPGAREVTVVGDFNDWNPSATPMHLAGGAELWAATVALSPGRYRYAYLVDGTVWLPDPRAPRALDDDFGRPNSVVTVAGT